LAASWPAPLVCDVIKRSRKRIKTSKSQSCRVTAGNGETSNGTPLGFCKEKKENLVFFCSAQVRKMIVYKYLERLIPIILASVGRILTRFRVSS
jgi:hypothetical protein